MNQEPLPLELRENVCEVARCNARATTVIAVKDGHYGIINLHVCEDCASKFEKEA